MNALLDKADELHRAGRSAEACSLLANAAGDIPEEAPDERVKILRKRLEIAGSAKDPALVLSGARELREELERSPPRLADRDDVARLLLTESDAAMEMRDAAEALPPLRRAVDLRRTALEVQPGTAGEKSLLEALLLLGRAYAASGDRDAAQRAVTEAERYESSAEPEDRRGLMLLVQLRTLRAALAAGVDRRAEAGELRSAIQLLKSVSYSEDTPLLLMRLQYSMRLADLLLYLGEPREAQQLLEECEAQLEALRGGGLPSQQMHILRSTIIARKAAAERAQSDAGEDSAHGGENGHRHGDDCGREH